MNPNDVFKLIDLINTILLILNIIFADLAIILSLYIKVSNY